MKKFLVISFLLIALIHIPALIYDWYYKIWWLDTPMHIFGGWWVGTLFLFLIQNFEKFKNLFRDIYKISLENIIIVTCYLGFVILIGVFWEYFEFFMDVIILKKYSYNLAPGYILFDTLKDLGNDLVGALLLLVSYLKTKTPLI